MKYISKSDYILGLKCPNALWFKKFRSDLESKVTYQLQTLFDTGHSVGDLACELFPGGTRITAKPWEDEAITQTRAAIKTGAPAIFEAVLKTSTNEYCAVDILRNNNDGTWDIIEVKSTTKPHEYHYLDISFQRYVMETAGLKIKNCFVMTLNWEYIRHGELDINKLFILHDASEYLKNMNSVKSEVLSMREVLAAPESSVTISKAKCCKFYECRYKQHCWADVPMYSVFDAFKSETADEIYAKHGADLRKIPSELYDRQMHCGDIESYLTEKENINPDGLREFLNSLQYPLYFLDYETIAPAVPLFDNSRPYQQICFQFSLHILHEPGRKLEHIEFLHNRQSDPRPDMICALIDSCKDNGSILVYNQSFEKSVNLGMMQYFPEHAAALESINNRIVDLLPPFRNRQLYRPCQNGSASLKEILPAFVPEMSYDNLEIRNGSEAGGQYMSFITGKLNADQTAMLMSNLREYCAQDTLAMVRLLEVIEEFAGRN